jgi:hypothetical protein
LQAALILLAITLVQAMQKSVSVDIELECCCVPTARNDHPQKIHIWAT